MNRALYFVDTETTGLYVDTDKIVELTYANASQEPHTLYFGVESVPPFIDDLIKFTERKIAGKKSPDIQFDYFKKATEGATMVAANPSFDSEFLKKYNLFNFHYRMLDIESYAMAKLGLDYVPSMRNIYDELVGRGKKLTEPDHTSYSDVKALREAYFILRYL